MGKGKKLAALGFDSQTHILGLSFYKLGQNVFQKG